MKECRCSDNNQLKQIRISMTPGETTWENKCIVLTCIYLSEYRLAGISLPVTVSCHKMRLKSNFQVSLRGM